MQSTLCALCLYRPGTSTSPNRDPILTKIFHLRQKSSAEKILRRNEAASVTVLRLNVPLQFLAQIMSTYYFWQEELRSVQQQLLADLQHRKDLLLGLVFHNIFIEDTVFVMEKRAKGTRLRSKDDAANTFKNAGNGRKLHIMFHCTLFLKMNSID